MTENKKLWKVKFKGKDAKYVATDVDDHNAAVDIAILGIWGDQASFEGLEPDHPIEKIEHLGEVVT